MKKMEITLPEGIEHYEPELRFFFDLMVRKLHICRDKGFAENCTATKMFLMINDELDELEEALANESQFQTALECVDVANQAWLMALVVLRATRKDFECQRQDMTKRKNRQWSKEEQEVLAKRAPTLPPIGLPIGYANGEPLRSGGPPITVRRPSTLGRDPLPDDHRHPDSPLPDDHRRPGGKSLEFDGQPPFKKYGHDGEEK